MRYYYRVIDQWGGVYQGSVYSGDGIECAKEIVLLQVADTFKNRIGPKVKLGRVASILVGNHPEVLDLS